MSRSDDPVEIYVEEVLADTDEAILCLVDGDTEAWIPRSQLLYTEVEEEGDSGNIEIPEWLAIDRELI